MSDESPRVFSFDETEGSARETPLVDSSSTDCGGSADEIEDLREVLRVFLTAECVRNRFINFFQKVDHTFVPSSRIVIPEDKSLLFVNAGMNQFKGIITGQVNDNKLRRAVNSQKCIRAGGKHNDLDDVGKDVYHHTFFEMLGTWSFGDYFKERAIDLAWAFLTIELDLDPDRFYVTYFDPEYNLPSGQTIPVGIVRDDETKDLWLRYLPADRVIPGSMKDNFWEMGETGPCGPCSEIHYDRLGRTENMSHLVNADNPSLIEVWNLVFMQFCRHDDGSLTELPERHVDTGMGFERLVSIVQDKPSNYDTDIFMPIFDAISDLTKIRAYTGKVGDDDVEADHTYADRIDTAYRVVADHMRTVCVAIADGVLPDYKDRGYVIRRILRRAIRFAKEKLFAQCGTLKMLVRPVCEVLSSGFAEFDPEANSKLIETIEMIVGSEEIQFYKSLDRGSVVLKKAIDQLGEKRLLPGDVAWNLYASIGYPLDLTILACEEKGVKVDVDGFDEARLQSLESSKRKPIAQIADDQVIDGIEFSPFAIPEHFLRELPATDDHFKYEYTWIEKDDEYVFPDLDAKVLAFVVALDNGVVESRTSIDNNFDKVAVILDRTCMYAESGGQLADKGLISAKNDDVSFNVVDVQKHGDHIVHYGRMLTVGAMEIGDDVSVGIHNSRRLSLMRNHTATHLLNAVLDGVLSRTEQRGSVVAHDKLRFDFLCTSNFGIKEVSYVQDMVNKYIKQGWSREIEEMKLEDAKLDGKIKFMPHETYPDTVRVVRFMNCDDAQGNWSVELCGGTHLHNTTTIKKFVITTVEQIARNVKRIIAVTGPEEAEIIAACDKSIEEELCVTEIVYDQLWDEGNIVELIDVIGVDVSTMISKLQKNFNSYLFKDAALQRLEKMRKTIMSEKRKKQTEAANLERVRVKGEVEKIEISPQYLVRYINPIPHITSISCNDNRKVVNLMLNGFRQKLEQTAVGLLCHLVVEENAIEFLMMASIPQDTVEYLPADGWIEAVVSTVKDRYGIYKGDECRVGGNPTTATGYGRVNCAIEVFQNVVHEIATEFLARTKQNEICDVEMDN